MFVQSFKNLPLFVLFCILVSSLTPVTIRANESDDGIEGISATSDDARVDSDSIMPPLDSNDDGSSRASLNDNGYKSNAKHAKKDMIAKQKNKPQIKESKKEEKGRKEHDEDSDMERSKDIVRKVDTTIKPQNDNLLDTQPFSNNLDNDENKRKTLEAFSHCLPKLVEQQSSKWMMPKRCCHDILKLAPGNFHNALLLKQLCNNPASMVLDSRNVFAKGMRFGTNNDIVYSEYQPYAPLVVNKRDDQPLLVFIHKLINCITAAVLLEGDRYRNDLCCQIIYIPWTCWHK